MTLQHCFYPGNSTVELLEGQTLYSIRAEAKGVLEGPTAGDPWDRLRVYEIRFRR